MTAEDLDALMNGFLDRTLPVAQWTHAAHCTVTACLLLKRPDLDLKAELPGLIRRYNEASGGQNTDTSGYHHSITLFYLEAISAFIAAQAHTDTVAVCRDLLASPVGDKDFALRYYSRERLFTPAARLGWVAPDLKALDLADILPART